MTEHLERKPRGVRFRFLTAAVALAALSGAAQAAEVAITALPTAFKAEVLTVAEGIPRTISRQEILMKGPPTYFEGLPVVVTERTDFNQPMPPYQFAVDRDVVVYLLVYERGESGIPADWNETGLEMANTIGRDKVYWKAFPAGVVEIPGHEGRNERWYGIPNAAIVSTEKIRDVPMPLRKGESSVTLPEGLTLSDLPVEMGAAVGFIQKGAYRAIMEVELTLLEVPDELEGLPYVTVNRGSGTEPAVDYSFSINKPATIYLLVHNRGLSGAPEGWRQTSMKTKSTNGVASLVFEKRVSPGVVEIPGHQGKAGKYYAVPNVPVIKVD